MQFFPIIYVLEGIKLKTKKLIFKNVYIFLKIFFRLYIWQIINQIFNTQFQPLKVFFMKSTLLAFSCILFCFLFSFSSARAQCCTVPDSLKVTSVTNNSFCVQWKVNDSLHCDSAKVFQIQHKLYGTVSWGAPKNRIYTGGRYFSYCDTATACAKYRWRVRKVCLHGSDTLLTAWVEGPVFTLMCGDSLGSGTSKTNKEFQSNSSIIITPNPARSTIMISGIYLSGKIQITISSIQGKKVFENTNIATPGRMNLPIDISSFNKGTYLVTISDASGITKLKFIKE